MRKFPLIVFVAALVVAGNVGASAQSRFGVIGGMAFMRSPDMSSSAYTLWNAGFTYRLGLPVGFSIQPSLVYQAKGAKTTEQKTIRTDYVELPVSVQWGPDLLVCRPFVDVTPFIGYAVDNRMKEGGTWVRPDGMWKSMNRFEYGVGVGLGLDVWRFQIIGRYMWNLEPLVDKNGGSNVVGEYVGDAFSKRSYRGFMLSLSFLFGGGRRR